jgi:hypothetical protein
MELDLTPIKARLAAASSGPWTAEDIGAGTIACGVVSPTTVIVEHDFIGSHDAEFCAHARQDIPALIAEVEKLRSNDFQLFHYKGFSFKIKP